MNDKSTERVYYGLEKHLQSFANWPNGELLYSSWIIEKQRRKERLKTVPMQYPHYSSHDESHSAKIVTNIEMFLGEERIKQLSASDTWMLLKGAYSHDIGMTMSANDLKSEFEKDKKFAERLKKSSRDNPRLMSALETLEPMFKLFEIQAENDYDWEEQIFEKFSNSIATEALKQKDIYDKLGEILPMQIIDDLNVIIEEIEEFARPNHHKYSDDILTREATECLDDFIPIRLRFLAAKIAYLHGDDAKNILDLPHRAIGICSDHLHPRFCALMIRIGDLLDMDNGRFNKYQLSVAGETKSGQLHRLKHDSIDTFEINEHKIVITANFKILENESDKPNAKILNSHKKSCMDAYKLLKKWISWLREELNFTATNWYEIVPSNLTGFCPQLKEGDFKINGEIIKDDEINLRYSISPHRSSELIEGSNIYSHPELTFIRELIQNAVDATKIQMCRDIYARKYPSFTLNEKNQFDKNWKDKFLKLTPYCFFSKFTDNLARYNIDITIDFNDEGQLQKNNTGRKQNNKECNGEDGKDITHVIIKVRDYGIGITYDDLKRMQNIGNIIKPEIEEEIKNMPEWFRPTGSFGIGLQSVFFVAKSFIIRSRSHGCPKVREMTFFLSKNGGEISVFEDDFKNFNDFPCGTEVEVKIPLDTYYGRILFMRQMMKRENYDVFSNNKTTIKNIIKEYIRKIYKPFGIQINYTEPEESSGNKIEDCLQLVEKEFSKTKLEKTAMCLKDMFGEFCILLDEDDVIVLKTEKSDFNKGFSVWSSKYNILIKYTNSFDSTAIRVQDKKSKIFYKNILVPEGQHHWENYEDYNYTKDSIHHYLLIPFFETEIFMFKESAETILMINREEFLYERKGTIIKNIQYIHLNAMVFLAWEFCNGKNKQFIDWVEHRKTFISKEAYSYLVLISYYMNDNLNTSKLISKINFEVFSIEVNKYNYENSQYENIKNSKDMKNIFHKDEKINLDIWFNNNNFGIPQMGVRSRLNGLDGEDIVKPPEFLIPDYFFNYKHFAIKEFTIVQSKFPNTTIHLSTILLYRIGKRSGEAMVINDYVYKSFCKIYYEEALKEFVENKESDDNSNNSYSEEAKDVRLIFPALGKYQNIEVTDIPERWKYGHIKKSVHSDYLKFKAYITKYDSWIISPLNLFDLIELKKSYDDIKKTKQKDYTQELTTEEKICDFKKTKFESQIDCYLNNTNNLFYRYIHRNKRKSINESVNISRRSSINNDKKNDYAVLKKFYKKWLIELFQYLE